MDNAKSIISLFGGINPMARALGHKHASTVQGWSDTGRIPPWRIHEIKEAAERLEIELPEVAA